MGVRICVAILVSSLCVAGATVVMSQAVPPDELRQRSVKLFRDGNFQEAYDGYQELCLNPNNDAAKVSADLGAAIQCLLRLGRVQELDQLLENTITAHAQNWRLLAAAARHYQTIPHHGFIIAGQFERGDHRGGGHLVHALERDRVRSLQLISAALPLAAEQATATEHGAVLLQTAEHLLGSRGYGDAWRLQALTDLSTLPDYDEGYGFARETSNAPVDRDGNPVFHQVPASWQAAATDGERWRWCLQQATAVDAKLKNSVRFQFAQFLHSQFGVQTLQEYGVFWGRTEREEPADTGVFALHTLGEHETIARLASGVKRFELPDEFNHIKILQTIAAEPETGRADDALQMLATGFEDRRQFPRALEYWEQSVSRFGRNNSKLEHIRQIRDNWGQFEPILTQPSGAGASVEFRFRNGKQVSFEAHAILVEKLLDDTKDYLKSAQTRQLDWQRLNIEDIGWRLVNENTSAYVGERVAQWDLELQPADKHFDKRITVTTPLQQAGAYLLTAKMADGNISRIVIWVADTAIVHKNLSEQNLYFVGDARGGAPVSGANVEFFGYRLRDRRGAPQIDTQNFAEKTDAQGLVFVKADRLSAEYQWMVVARGAEGRLAYLGFQGVWAAGYHDPEYHATKAFSITDRPVYRPGQKVQYKVWFRHARYDQDNTSDYAGQNFAIRLIDPRGEEIQTVSLKADAYGGVAGEFDLPTGAMLGQYRLDTDFSTPIYFRVEEYKKPEFEVTVDAPAKPVMLGEEITATIKARYYFGSPVINATVKYRITRTTRDQDWYPIRPWDWCYGPGYWWFAYDYDWYPGWQNWVGCVRPRGWWWPHFPQPPEIVAEHEVEIGPDGTVAVNIDTAVAKAVHGDQDHEYTITAEVRDQSRRTIVGTGSVLVARQPFKVYLSVDRGYYRVGDTVEAQILAQTLDQRPVAGPAEATLYKITYDEQRKPIETPVSEWALTTDAQGAARLQLTASEKGQYRLACQVTDESGHRREGGYIFTIIGEGFDGSEYRFNSLELLPDRPDYAPGDTVKLQINTDHPDSTVLVFQRPTNGVYLPPQVVRMTGKSTVIEIPVSKRDMPNFFVEAVTIAEGRLHEELKELIVPPENRVLQVEVVPNQTEYKPGEKASVQVQLKDFSGEAYVGSLVATMYDKSLEYISGGSNVSDIREFFWKWRRDHHPSHRTSLERGSHNLLRPREIAMRPIGAFGDTIADDQLEMTRSADKGGAMMMRGGFGGGAPGAPMAAMAEGAPTDAFFGGPGEGGAAGAPAAANLVEPTVRTNFADSAFWVGTLETNDQGVAVLPVDMPENLTAWKITVWGLGHGTRVGSGQAEVVTRKNLLLRMQTPRFAVQTDEVVLSANVHNYLATDKQVVVSLESPGDILQPLDAPSQTVAVAANGEARVDWRVRVVREGTATVRMKALTDEESDAAQLTFPCHVHGILKTEAWAGTVRPDQTVSSAVAFQVPDARRIEQSVLEVRYSPSLAGAMVDALPYLIDYPYGCTEQTLNRFLPAVLTQKVLLEMNLDLAAIREKRTNLNAQEIGDDPERAAQWKRLEREPVFDPEELERIVKEGVTRLTNMQNVDGGWGWFSGFSERSYPHTTAVVVRGLSVAAQNDVALVPGVLEQGVEWLKRYEQEQVREIRNADGKIHPWKPHADELDALIHLVLTDAGQVNSEMRDFLYRDRNELTVYAKALLGLALERQQEADKVAMLVRNLKQYLVEDAENETAYLRLSNENHWWNWYGDEIEAQAAYLKLLARVEPRGATAPRVVKYLLNNRKHATYWKSTRDTALCVEAFADFLRASGETRPDMTVEVWLDGMKRQEVAINAENFFSFRNKFVLQGAEVASGGHLLELRRRGEGPVYFNVYLTNFTLEDPIAAAGLEVKVQRKFYKLSRDDRQIDVAGDRGQVVGQRVEKYVRTEIPNLGLVQSGDLVEIELEIDSKNDYEYLMFEDWKVAGFEPVEVQSGYTANGLGAYMELRDDRVTFFVRQLARGQHSLSYRLRAEIPGSFSALPAQASAMYAPELRGNSHEMKVQIQ